MSRERLTRCATALARRIVGARAVAVDATATLETVVAVVAGIIAGVPVVPLPPDAGILELGHIIRNSGAELLLCTRGSRADIVGLPEIPVDVTARAAGAVTCDLPRPTDTATALILYTSGTTGPPKGATISRAAIVADLEALADAWAWTPDDTLVHGLPLFHVHGLILGVLGPLHLGSGLRHTGRATPTAYAQAGGTIFFGVPTIWSRIAADPAAARALRSARLLVSGSAALPTPVFASLVALTGHRPVERYGMTETLITVSARADGERRPGYVGLPLRGVETTLLGEAGASVPADGSSFGELLVRGSTMFSGYHATPALTTDAVPDAVPASPPDGAPALALASLDAAGWFHTGDIATIGPDGWHRIVGRASSDIIKSGGYRIGAGEVENALLAHPGVREAAVVGTPHPDLGEQVTAYVVADGVASETLIAYVATTLSAHKRPRAVHLVEALPRNAMGKVRKSLLTEL